MAEERPGGDACNHRLRGVRVHSGHCSCRDLSQSPRVGFNLYQFGCGPVILSTKPKLKSSRLPCHRGPCWCQFKYWEPLSGRGGTLCWLLQDPRLLLSKGLTAQTVSTCQTSAQVSSVCMALHDSLMLCQKSAFILYVTACSLFWKYVYAQNITLSARRPRLHPQFSQPNSQNHATWSRYEGTSFFGSSSLGSSTQVPHAGTCPGA